MIEWEQSTRDGSVHYGTIGGVRLYVIRRTHSHANLWKGFPVAMEHRLPFAPIARNWKTVEGAKEYAERHLDAAMLHLGYVRRTPR